jgi:single-strand DNA-binding protein
MASVNNVILIGNLTRDPELRYTPKGTAVAEIGLACNRRYKSGHGELQEEVTYIDITFWGSLAETVSKYLEKGRSVYVEGRLKLDQWDDKDTGKKRSKLSVVGEQCQFLGSKNQGDQSNSSGYQDRPANTTTQAKPPATTGQGPLSNKDEEEDGMPF